MRFIIADKKLLEQSKYYDKEKCWDYPLNELDHVLFDSESNSKMVYVICEDKRIYETTCEQEKINKLFKDLNQEPILNNTEMAELSYYIKLWVKAGENSANKKLEEWKERMKLSEPKVDEILNQAKTILKPLDGKINEAEEKNYIIFVLGYDLLNEELMGVPYPECDLAYERCRSIAEDFLNSEYNVNTKSLYDCLVDYVEDKKYIKFIYEEDEILEKGE